MFYLKKKKEIKDSIFDSNALNKYYNAQTILIRLTVKKKIPFISKSKLES